MDVPEGPWEPSRDAAPFAGAFGVLVVRGLLLTDLRLDRGGATELVGPGDLLRLWPTDDELLPFTSGIVVVQAARVAVLDGSLPELMRRWPGVGARLVAQSTARHRRQVQHRAASQLPRVEDRILALLWLLAERWGRVGNDGVIVPMALTHELLGRLVGARRPTVTMAIGQLVDDGHVRRRPDRSVVLSPASRRVLVPGDALLSKVADAQLVEVGPLAPAPARSAPGPGGAEHRRLRPTPATDAELQRRRALLLGRDRERAVRRAHEVTLRAQEAVARSRARRAGLGGHPDA